jgi:PAS domain-containing protein
LLDNAYTGMIVLDQSGKILKANQMALKLLNCSIEQLLQQPMDHFLLTEHLNPLNSSDCF